MRTGNDKKQARRNFDGSDRLFNACWRAYTDAVRDGLVPCRDGIEMDEFLNYEASRLVNDERSSFYICG